MSETTSDFQALLDTIETGVYGRDIRGAIHQALAWLKENAGDGTQTSGKQKMVYCWGDSLTEGVGGWDADNFIQSAYPDEISLPHINLGCRGEDIQTIMARQGADPIVLTTAVTLPASKSEAVQIGTMTMPFSRYEGVGLTTKSGETVKPCIEREVGINPCLIGGVECELFREVTSTLDSETTYSYKIRRLEDGDAVTLAKGTEIQTFASRYYRNGFAVIWMGANGRANSHQEYVQKIKKMVEYGEYENYLVLLCREYAEQWVYDGAGYQGIKSLLTDEDGTCHLLYLPPELIRRGYLLAGLSTQTIDTSGWDTTDAILKAAPKLMAANSSAATGYETLHFSKWGYRAIGKLVDERLNALVAETKEPEPEPEPITDQYGTLLYKLDAPMTFTGATYLDTGVKLYANGDADNWCVCLAYSGETQGFLVRQGGAGEGWTAYGGSGAVRMDLAMEHTSKAWSEIVNADGSNVLIVSKDGTSYSFYMNGCKAYNSALGYALDAEKYIPTDVPLIIAGRHNSTLSGVDHLTGFTLKDARVYNAAMSDAQIALITAEMLALT